MSAAGLESLGTAKPRVRGTTDSQNVSTEVGEEWSRLSQVEGVGRPALDEQRRAGVTS